MGFKTIAIARGKDKEELAKKLGAIHYIDSKSQNPVEELAKLGGAKPQRTIRTQIHSVITCIDRGHGATKRDAAFS
jgi:D-arabinose 1-dehydrogenase-like Zn-dependent alcohol dehydrogenase